LGTRLGDRRPCDLPAAARRALACRSAPALLPRKGRFGLVDYEKAFCPDPTRADIFDLRGISRDRGCVAIVRPDQYVSDILPLAARDALSAFFDRILIRRPPP
jgi:phenol 2-monooxygenase